MPEFDANTVVLTPGGPNYLDVVINGRKYSYHEGDSVRGGAADLLMNNAYNEPHGERGSAGICLVRCYNPGGPDGKRYAMDRTDAQITEAHKQGERVVFMIDDPDGGYDGRRMEATMFEVAPNWEVCQAFAFDPDGGVMIYNDTNGNAQLVVNADSSGGAVE